MNLPRTKLIPNGDNIVHTFTDTEYKNRQARLRQHMAENNIDAVYEKKQVKEKEYRLISASILTRIRRAVGPR